MRGMKQFIKSFWKSQKIIWLFLGDQRKKYVFYNILIFLVFFYELVPAFIFGKIVDFFTHYEKGQNLWPFYILGITLSVSWSLVSILRLTCKNILNKISITTKSRTKILLINNLLNLSAEFHHTKNSGNSLQQILTGSGAIRDIIRLFYKDIWQILSSFFGVIIIFIFLSPTFLVFMILYTVVFFSVEFYFNKKIFALSEIENKMLEKTSGALIESTSNILAVKSLGFEEEIHQHLSKNEESTRAIQLRKASINNLKWKFFQVLNGISLGVFVWLIGLNVIHDLMTVGSILVFYSYYNKLREATQSATDTTTEFIEYASNLDRLQEIINSDKTTIRHGREFPKNWHKLVFKNINFMYPSNGKGLFGVNLEIPKREVLGVVGSSGGGKSTLAKLLIDLYQPSEGCIVVDDIEYSKISHSGILDAVSIVPQEAELFNLSLSDNITIMREVDINLLNKILKVTELTDVIQKLPNGVNTLIGEKGYSLSGGERQRVGIARALYKNSEVVIFDEATSMLDGKTEKKIIKNVLQEFKGKKTFVFIAHRLAALDSADRIIVFKDGRLVEEGTFTSLKENNGVFAELFESQIKNVKS
jgi:ABC-type multidrug transport system fused ATPase/permease subunit